MGMKTTGAINLNKENEGSWSNGSDTSCEVNLKAPEAAAIFNSQRNKHAAAAVFPAAVGHNLPVANECFGSMFGGIEETQEFWPWSEQQNFH